MNARKNGALPWHITGELLKSLIISGQHKRVIEIVGAFVDLKENDRLDDAAIEILEEIRTGNSTIDEAPRSIVVVDGVRNALVYISRDVVIEMTRKAIDDLGLSEDSPVRSVVDVLIAKMFTDSVSGSSPERLDISINALIRNQIPMPF